MLVLSRKIGQRITVGDNIQVVVLDVQGNQVRLGIEAPREVAVHRAEVAARIAAEHSPVVRAVRMPWTAPMSVT